MGFSSRNNDERVVVVLLLETAEEDEEAGVEQEAGFRKFSGREFLHFRNRSKWQAILSYARGQQIESLRSFDHLMHFAIFIYDWSPSIFKILNHNFFQIG